MFSSQCLGGIPAENKIIPEVFGKIMSKFWDIVVLGLHSALSNTELIQILKSILDI